MERGRGGRGQANEGAVEATGLTVEGIEAGLEPVSALGPPPPPCHLALCLVVPPRS